MIMTREGKDLVGQKVLLTKDIVAGSYDMRRVLVPYKDLGFMVRASLVFIKNGLPELSAREEVK